MKNITDMGRDELLTLRPESIDYSLHSLKVLHIAKTLGAFWVYDYEASGNGKLGLHAELKSGLHSDGFFISRILLEPENIRLIIARQMAKRIRQRIVIGPEYLAGVPDGATGLGKDVARMLNAKEAIMEKRDGRIYLLTNVGLADILLVEDFCTRGTGLREAVTQIKHDQPSARILPYDPVIINRGGLEFIPISESTVFKVVPVVEWKIQDWSPDQCPLCALGSKVIKPKATDENWRLITESQK